MKYLVARLTEASSYGGIAGILGGIGLVLEGNVELGVAAILTGIAAILKAEKGDGRAF